MVEYREAFGTLAQEALPDAEPGDADLYQPTDDGERGLTALSQLVGNSPIGDAIAHADENQPDFIRIAQCPTYRNALVTAMSKIIRRQAIALQQLDKRDPVQLPHAYGWLDHEAGNSSCIEEF